MQLKLVKTILQIFQPRMSGWLAYTRSLLVLRGGLSLSTTIWAQSDTKHVLNVSIKEFSSIWDNYYANWISLGLWQAKLHQDTM